MQIIGHRGARGLAKENTLDSIRLALEHDVDMIEVDLRLDEHQTIVLAHDPVVFGVDYTTLQEMLDKIDNDVALNLELKEPEVALKLRELLEGYEGTIVVSSYNSKALRIARKELPEATLAVLETWSSLRAVYKARALNTQRIHMNHTWLWSRVIRSLRSRGYHIYAYTVNDVLRAEKLQSWGISGVFTDFPDRIKSA